MSREIRSVLCADGESDKALLPILVWAIRQALPEASVARPKFLVTKGIDATISTARQYEPDIVFVHRDAERETYQARCKEIPQSKDVVPVVPVRMTEAWLLIDKGALRRAANNPKGSVTLDFPPLSQLEKLPDPKDRLFTLLKEASGLHGRRRHRFNEHDARQRLAESIDDFAPLLKLSAFQAFFEKLRAAFSAST